MKTHINLATHTQIIHNCSMMYFANYLCYETLNKFHFLHHAILLIVCLFIFIIIFNSTMILQQGYF